jgi:putative FmdB family regulatory protein
MPLYEYECEACAHRFERIQKYSDPPIETCPKCGSKVRKLFSSPAIQFKGSGFYITDYPKSGSSADPARSGASKSDKSEKGDKSSDSKSSDSSSSDSTSSAAKTVTKSDSKAESKT